ncbi:hypothetical protein CR513_28108, partial [Mucuna pruriens]
MSKKSSMNETLKIALYILNKVPTKAVNKTPYKLWTDKKSSIKHLHIWGYPVEARPYRSHERKLDSRIILFETRNARFLEEVEFGKEENIRNVIFGEESVNDIGQVLVPIIVEKTTPIIGDNIHPQTPIEQPQQYQRSIKERRHAIIDDYIIFLQEHEDDISLTKDDPINFCQTMQSSNSQKWIDAMKDEMKSMQDNDLIYWLDSKGNIKRYKARLFAKGFT